MSRKTLIILLLCFFIGLNGCLEQYEMKVEVTSTTGEYTIRSITVKGGLVGNSNYANQRLPWSEEFEVQEGDVITVNACCGDDNSDLIIIVSKNGDVIASESGVSPSVKVEI